MPTLLLTFCISPPLRPSPHLDGLVGGARPQEVLHRVEVQAGDGVCVASQLTQLLVGHQVPDLSGDQVWESMGTGDWGYRCQCETVSIGMDLRDSRIPLPFLPQHAP